MKDHINQLTEENMYVIGKDGSVYSKYCNRFLKPDVDKDGYLIITLTIDKKPKKIKLHRLVAMMYIENPMYLSQINHIDGDKLNNYTGNLEWSDAVKNNRHKNSKNNCKRYGVWKHLGKWRSQLQFNKDKRIEIGIFSDKEDAYEAFYNVYYSYYQEYPWDKNKIKGETK